MTNLRPFLSYASSDRDVADRVARHLTACGILPIYDIWWLRQMPGSDVPSSFEEIKMGINHSNAFVYFDSTAARQSHTCRSKNPARSTTVHADAGSGSSLLTFK